MRLLFSIRALAAFAVGVFLIFNQGHYVASSLIALASFTLALSAGQLAVAVFGKSELSAIESVPTTIISLTIGVLAAVAQVQGVQNHVSPAITIQQFEWLLTGWALTTGAFELYLARRYGFKTIVGRDFLILAIMSLLLGLLNLVIDMDRTTTVGMFVAYLAFSSVHLGIAATSPKVDVETEETEAAVDAATTSAASATR